MHKTEQFARGAGIGLALVLVLAAGCAGAPQPEVEHASQEVATDDGAVAAAGVEAVAEQAAIETREVSYEVDGQPFTGYLAIAGRAEPGPAVLIVHEWWGHTQFVRDRAEALARLGYTALALDMYGTGKVTKHPQEAKAFMEAAISDVAVAERRIAAAYELLVAEPSVDGARVGAIGYCFGGAVVLHAMRAQVVPLQAVASFHGSLGSHMKTPVAPGTVETKVLVMTGEADPLVPAEQVVAFEAEMKAAQVDARIIAYPGAMHAFTNPEATALGQATGLPLAYNPEADAQSWAEMQQLFEAEL